MDAAVATAVVDYRNGRGEQMGRRKRGRVIQGRRRMVGSLHVRKTWASGRSRTCVRWERENCPPCGSTQCVMGRTGEETPVLLPPLEQTAATEASTDFTVNTGRRGRSE